MKTLTGATRIAGVMGYPVTHSLSPRLHGYWLHRYEIDGTYIPLSVRPEGFSKALAAIPDLGWFGVNVTVPHKEAALAAVDTASEDARRIGAVNTVVVGRDGDLHGSNTDGFGFVENLKAGYRGWTAERGPAVVLGAGGAARAVCAVLIDGGVPEIRLINRTRSRAEILASDLDGPVEIVPWELRAEALDGAALLVNTTTLGMTGNPPLDLVLAALPSVSVVTDIVYNPLETALLRQATLRGNPVVDGLGMLLHQARPGFAAWFGVEPEVTPELRAFVLDGLSG
jgi:shikimate dehydrogenase